MSNRRRRERPRENPAYRRGDEFEITPTRFGRGGDATARIPGGRVSIPDALPGEVVRVRALARRKGVLHARVVEVIEASPDRVIPPCAEVGNGCGACQWQHLALDAQRAAKRDRVALALGVDATELAATVALADTTFRTTLDLGVERGRAGFRRYRSHRTVPIAGCLVAHPLLVDLITEADYGDATEVLLRCGARTGERMAAPLPADAEIRVPEDVARDVVHEEAAGRTWRISADSFAQASPEAMDVLTAHVLAAAAEVPTRQAVDLYCGVGIFAGALADRGWSVAAVEGAPSAAADARHNLDDLDIDVIEGDVTTWAAAPTELVVADPSRAGLGPDGAAVIDATGATRVVLVSCDTYALSRDCAHLRGFGFTLTRATPIDQFPHTPHVEVVSVFDR
ncbi:MAG: class I SAM-dependent RNA methyltransferase [Actinomycetota bacterium]